MKESINQSINRPTSQHPQCTHRARYNTPLREKLIESHRFGGSKMMNSMHKKHSKNAKARPIYLKLRSSTALIVLSTSVAYFQDGFLYGSVSSRKRSLPNPTR